MFHSREAAGLNALPPVLDLLNLVIFTRFVVAERRFLEGTYHENFF